MYLCKHQYILYFCCCCKLLITDANLLLQLLMRLWSERVVQRHAVLQN